MDNPKPAFRNTRCDQCGQDIDEGEDVFLCDGKYCRDCADENGNVCECGSFKKEEFKECFDCHAS